MTRSRRMTRPTRIHVHQGTTNCAGASSAGGRRIGMEEAAEEREEREDDSSEDEEERTSVMQAWEQPSLSVRFASSHCSPSSSRPFPQTGRRGSSDGAAYSVTQALVQPSPSGTFT